MKPVEAHLMNVPPRLHGRFDGRSCDTQEIEGGSIARHALPVRGLVDDFNAEVGMDKGSWNAYLRNISEEQDHRTE